MIILEKTMQLTQLNDVCFHEESQSPSLESVYLWKRFNL